MGRRTDCMGRQSFLFGFQSASEVLFLPEVSLSISLLFFFFFKHVFIFGCIGSCSIRDLCAEHGLLSTCGLQAPECSGFSSCLVAPWPVGSYFPD